MNNELQLKTIEQTTVARPVPQLSVAEVFSAIQDKNISPENIMVMKELLAIDARQKFDDAFAKLQADLPVIVAKTAIKNRGKYEKYEDIMAVVQPVLTKYQFSVAFENDFKENKIGETCILSHAGHERRTTYWTRASGNSDSDTQADSKAATTARRNALIRALNLVIRQDALLDEENDPRNAGSVITAEQADEVERRVKLLNLNPQDWLELGGCKSFKEMLSASYAVVDRALAMRERRGR